MANEREFINSFQGKNINSAELQNLDNNSYFDIVSRYNVSDDGVLTSKIKPVYNNSFNNPAPQDPSNFNPPPADPIRITRPDALDVPASTIEYSTLPQSEISKLQRIVINPGREYETSSRYGDRGRFEQFDSPEESIDSADIDEATFDLAGYASRSLDGELGPPVGLNESARLRKKIGSSKDAVSLNSGVFIEDITKLEINPRPNELNTYSSVSYNLALYMMNSRAYVDITSSPRDPNTVLDPESGISKLLMRSGGVGLDNVDTEFNNDFFIDDLELINIAVGPNKFKQNTNATDIRFTISEPRGVTLLEKLRNLAGTVLASTGEKYIHAPYLLEITFKGYDENGKPVPNGVSPKYIPIRITDIQFDVTAQGTQYRVTAIPYANHVMGSISGVVPFNTEISAITVGDIFSAGVIIEEVRDVRQGIGPDVITGGQTRIVQKRFKSPRKNLGEVLTDYQKKRTLESVKLIEKNLEIKEEPVPPAAEKYDSYEFKIAREIAESKLNFDGLYDALNQSAPTEETVVKKDDSADKRQFEAYVQGLAGGVTLDKDTRTFKINAGTDITKLINLIIMHSDYMDQNVLENPSQYANSGEPINWFKVRPVIKSADAPGTGYDNKDGRFKYNITYAVEKNNIYYNDFPWAKKGQPIGRGFHKQYDYIFSGNNTEVLDFDLKFKTAFMQVMTAGTGSPFGDKTAENAIAPIVKEVPQTVEGNTINGQDSVRRARAKDLFSSVMSDGFDLIDLDLSIVGDPSYICTSDAYWQDKVRAGQTYTEAYMPDGTINYNISPVYVQVNLKTPVDYSETTGLANPNLEASSFSGIYQLTQVESTFTGGVFQQKLRGLRTGLQPTSGGLQRSLDTTLNTERRTYTEDTDDQRDQTFLGAGVKKLTSSVAKVVDPGTGIDQVIDSLQDTPYTSPQVNNVRTAQIAQQADQSVLTINDPNDVTATEAWLSRYPDGL